MNDLSNIFNSRTHFLVLQVLSLRKNPSHVRGLADLTHQYIHSIENTLKDLSKKKVIVCKKKNNSVWIKLNEKNKYVPTLRKMFQLVKEEEVSENSKELNIKAKSLLSFLDSSYELLKAVKSK